MLTLKFLKIGNARFISHVELLRQFSRILRRAGIEIKFSNGFNPHGLVFFSPPGALGAGSMAEYVSIDTETAGEDVIKRYNASVTEDLKALRYFETKTNPNLAGRITAADYVFPTEFFPLDRSDFIITYDKKGESVTENAGDRILSVFDADGRLGMRLCAGNVNLRPDRVIAGLKQKYGLDVSLADTLKISQYINSEEADIYLQNFNK